MPPLTQKQLDQISEVITDFHTAVIVQHVDPNFVPAAKIEELKRKGFIAANATLRSLPFDAYLFSRFVRAVELSQAKAIPFYDFLLWLKKNPIDLTKVEKLAIEYAKANAARKVVGLGNILDADFNVLVADGDRLQAERLRKIIQEGVAQTIQDRNSRNDLVTYLREQIGDYARDWHRIAFTEMQDSLQAGLAADIADRNPGARVAKVPRPDACPYCNKLYLDANGRPKIFKLSEIAGNSNYKKKRSEWQPTVGTLHPLCACSLVEVPDGFEFDDRGFLVPTAEEPGEYVEAE